MCVESSDNVYMFNIGKHMNDSIDIHVQCHNKPTFTCTSLVLCRHIRLVQYTRCTHTHIITAIYGMDYIQKSVRVHTTPLVLQRMP